MSAPFGHFKRQIEGFGQTTSLPCGENICKPGIGGPSDRICEFANIPCNKQKVNMLAPTEHTFTDARAIVSNPCLRPWYGN